jgi:hypothetical protein
LKIDDCEKPRSPIFNHKFVLEVTMAVVRTLLPRKGIIQPKHGDNYEADLDTNWQIIDSLLQDGADVQAAVSAAGTVAAWLRDCGLSGVVSGFNLSPSATLTPSLSPGVLYSQGVRYAPATANPGAAPPNTTSYLWWNSVSGFYFDLTGLPAASGDAFLGTVTTDSTRVTATTNSTKLYGLIQVTAPAAGSFSLPHNLGRTPCGTLLYPTCGGVLWFQLPTIFDMTYLYLVASEVGITANVQIW